MGFEYDRRKSASNKRKHGISFSEACALCDDLDAIILPAIDCDESRYMVIGTIGTKHWTAVVTDRNDNVRLISVRRSRTKEVLFYEKNQSGDS